MTLLDPQTFHIIKKSRKSLHDLENALLTHGASRQRNEAEEYNEIFTDVGDMVTRTKSLVEIEQDDHGKAILVFTIVTITFLPLSFVSSFLGMNTQDVRNQTNSQWIFWATALPLTLAVVLVTMYISYHTNDLRDRWEKIFVPKQYHKTLDPKPNDSQGEKREDWGNKLRQRSRKHYIMADDVEPGRRR
jgi:CorA-like Mg2+ transporter protein